MNIYLYRLLLFWDLIYHTKGRGGVLRPRNQKISILKWENICNKLIILRLVEKFPHDIVGRRFPFPFFFSYRNVYILCNMKYFFLFLFFCIKNSCNNLNPSHDDTSDYSDK